MLKRLICSGLLTIAIALMLVLPDSAYSRVGGGQKYSSPSRTSSSKPSTSSYKPSPSITNNSISRVGGGQRYSSPSRPSSSPSRPSSSPSRSSSSPSSPSSGPSSYGGGGVGCCGGIGVTLIGIIVFIIILVVVILWIVKGGFKGKGTSTPSTMDSSGQEYGTAMETVYDENLQAEMANLKEADPGFSESVFKDKAQTIFLKIQQAWTQKKWELARPYETDTIFNRHQSQMDDYITGHKRNVLEDIIIGGIDIVKVQCDQYYDNIIVRIKAQMLDYDIDETTKQVISGDNKTPRSFSEYWTFTRKAGVKSKGPEGVASDKCPNCGAPLNINQSGQCEYCGSIVTKGDFDWVLSSIVQDEEYQG